MNETQELQGIPKIDELAKKAIALVKQKQICSAMSAKYNDLRIEFAEQCNLEKKHSIKIDIEGKLYKVTHAPKQTDAIKVTLANS